MKGYSKRLADVQEYYFSQKLREVAQLQAAGKPIINMGIGSPDLPPHPCGRGGVGCVGGEAKFPRLPRIPGNSRP
jgi:hypothetical protein